jgi:REP-associated tyrosine transposase
VSDDSKLPNRQSIRLRGRDYSQGGIYFVTLCTHDRRHLFGQIVEETMRLNSPGEIVRDSWEWLDRQYGHVDLGEFVVMPNHFHGILKIHPDIRRGSTASPARKPLGRLLAAFKTASTNRINKSVAVPFDSVWQRNYFEHIVRNEEEFVLIRKYIHDNPRRWAWDRENNLVKPRTAGYPWEV